MKRLFTGFLPLIALLSMITSPMRGDCSSVSGQTTKTIIRRSDSLHKARQMVGETEFVHKFDAESWYGDVYAILGYSQTFHTHDLAECLLGGLPCPTGANGECCDAFTIRVQGGAVEGRDPNSWFADYFYLPGNYDGSFSIKPRIKTFFADFGVYVGLDEWVTGLYFRLHGPVVHTRWNLNFCESTSTATAPSDHRAGYFTQDVFLGTDLVQSLGDYMNGATPKQPAAGSENAVIGPDDTAVTWVFQPLKYARMSRCGLREVGFADLRAEVGWNFLQCEDYHLGVNLQFAAPTGDKRCPNWLFAPYVGNGGHWELGGGVTGHYTFWTSEDGDSHFGFHLDASVTHLFDKRQTRTFDLKCKPNSVYMLAARFAENTAAVPPDDQVVRADVATTAVVDDGEPATNTLPSPNRQFALEYAPVANLSTICLDVSVGAQADVVAMFNYTCGGLSWDFGYNLYARSCEKLDCPDKCNPGTLFDPALANTWALKGDARMFGFQVAPGATPAANGAIFAIPLSATNSCATITGGSNAVVPGSFEVAPADTNLNIDDPKFALWRNWDTSVSPAVITEDAPLAFSRDPGNFTAAGGADSVDLTSTDVQIRTSGSPRFLNGTSLDLTRVRNISHTIFSHLSYTFDRECWVPFIGIGSSVEFGQTHHGSDCETACSPCPTTTTATGCQPCNGSCIDCTLSQWSIWVKGGVAFN